MKLFCPCALSGTLQSPSTRREWIEIYTLNPAILPTASPSTRREWIEMLRCTGCAVGTGCLPPHGGSGLKSSVLSMTLNRSPRLPPHGGSGLKCRWSPASGGTGRSPSTRREWIEISPSRSGGTVRTRLPPHGGSGLKLFGCQSSGGLHTASPSTRREWIEIYEDRTMVDYCAVSLHTEGVD